MAIDYIIDLPCRPKRDLGEGDHGRGTEHILDCLKARNRTDLIRELAARDGRRPEGLSITLRVQHADGDAVDRSVTYEELVARGRELEPFESECASCPANVRGRPFGCIGAVNYPIPRRAEEWLMDRLLPTSTFGGELCRRALGDLNYTGEPIRRLREAGFFESPTAVVRILDDSATGLTVTPANRGEVIGQDVRSDAVVNSDQILEAF